MNYQLLVPGVMPDHPNAEAVSALLRTLMGTLPEAQVALQMFSNERARGQKTQEALTPAVTSEDWPMDTTEQKGLTRELFSDILPKLSIAAKAFVFALDKCRNTLSELERIEKEAGSTRPIVAVRASFLGSFPDLKGVRDSAHHEEQRAQQKRDRGKPITAQPVNKLGISCDATSTVFAVGLISGSKYCATMANGHLGEVDVSFKSLEILRDAIQSALDAYKWRGPRSIYPNY